MYEVSHTHFPIPVLVLEAGSLFMFALGFLLTANAQTRRRFFALPPLLQKACVFVFMAPIAAMPLVPQARYQSAPLASTLAGALLLACAVCLWASALRAMRGVPSMREAKGLVTTGAYGLVRNPLYTANALVLPGLGLLTQSLAAPFFTPVVVVQTSGTLDERRRTPWAG